MELDVHGIISSNLARRLSVLATTRTGYIVSSNLIGSGAERKHWLDRGRTKLHINISRARNAERS